MAARKTTKKATATKKTSSKRATKKTASKKPAARATKRKPASKSRRSNGNFRIKVRMYRQGLGDCFLLTIPRNNGKPFYAVIDCGVILGTKDAGKIMKEVVARSI